MRLKTSDITTPSGLTGHVSGVGARLTQHFAPVHHAELESGRSSSLCALIQQQQRRLEELERDLVLACTERDLLRQALAHETE
jgi:hypothetical protein